MGHKRDTALKSRSSYVNGEADKAFEEELKRKCRVFVSKDKNEWLKQGLNKETISETFSCFALSSSGF